MKRGLFFLLAACTSRDSLDLDAQCATTDDCFAGEICSAGRCEQNAGASGTTGIIAGSGDAPAGLTYSTNPAHYLVGVAIAPNTPASSGAAPSAYAVAPALPVGLALDVYQGTIHGTPTAVSPSVSYVVTASNSAGAAMATLAIDVDAPLTGVSYVASSPSYVGGASVAPDVAQLAGGVAPFSFSITPSLASFGLSIDASSGTISGSPPAVSSAQSTMFLISVTDAVGGAASTHVNVTITPPPCQGTCLPWSVSGASGWIGPVALAVKAVPDALAPPAAPQCASGAYENSALGAVYGVFTTSGPVSCGTGACGYYESCSVYFSYFTDTGCGTLYAHESTNATGQCYSVSGYGGTFGSAMYDSPIAYSCSVHPQTAVVPTLSYQWAKACAQPAPALASGICAAGATCWPSPGADYESTLCIYQQTNPAGVMCPSGFGNQTVYYEGYSDTRSCDGCYVAANGVCSSTLGFYSSANTCISGGVITTYDTACHPAPNTTYFAFDYTISPSCTPGGAAVPSGAVTGNTPVVMCCQ